jgi:hypothetical protein
MIKSVMTSSFNAVSRGKAGADMSNACAPCWSACLMIDHVSDKDQVVDTESAWKITAAPRAAAAGM